MTAPVRTKAAIPTSLAWTLPTPGSQKVASSTIENGPLTRRRFRWSVEHVPSRTRFRALTIPQASSVNGLPLTVSPRA